MGGAQNQKPRSSGIRSGRGVGKVLQPTPGPDAGVPKARTWVGVMGVVNGASLGP